MLVRSSESIKPDSDSISFFRKNDIILNYSPILVPLGLGVVWGSIEECHW
jgi:hypothetical protein